MQKVITDDLDALIDIFPPYIRQSLRQMENIADLLEVIIDLGRFPEARFLQQEVVLDEKEATAADIEYVTSRISSFGGDNRAGIARTLHRISAIRNRKGDVVGLTCRVGRAVFGTIEVIHDFIESGKSVLLLGRPGVGKTTMLREVARVLSVESRKRVVIVDTSNEIAGDGDIPHPAIGRSRRMQVSTPTMQHAVMIEAVENHMPEVIVIDEIGTELEALAARTIAERGVQLVGTAHGNTLENLLANPTLCDLVGGIQSVTLGDEEAKRRGTQKTILERMAPPTFNIVVEIQDWDRVAIHADVAEAVDTILREQAIAKEIRWRDESGVIKIEKELPLVSSKVSVLIEDKQVATGRSYNMYLFGVDRKRFEMEIREHGLKLRIVNNLKDSDIFVTSKSYYRRKPQKIRDAESLNLPIYVLKTNNSLQIRQLLSTIFPIERRKSSGAINNALKEAEGAMELIRDGHDEIELSPQSSYIRRLQHLLVERNGLSSESYGRDPERRVRIIKKESVS